jgi:hypothetical protein
VKRPFLSKCLESDRELRYQHASEIRTDLRRSRVEADSRTNIAKHWKVIAPVAAAVMATFAAAYFHLHRAPILTGKDTIVLADFINRTSDPVFDGTLRESRVMPQAELFQLLQLAQYLFKAWVEVVEDFVELQLSD